MTNARLRRPVAVDEARHAQSELHTEGDEEVSLRPHLRALQLTQADLAAWDKLFPERLVPAQVRAGMAESVPPPAR